MLLSHPAEFSERLANNRKSRIPDLLGIMSNEVGQGSSTYCSSSAFAPVRLPSRIGRQYGT